MAAASFSVQCIGCCYLHCQSYSFARPPRPPPWVCQCCVPMPLTICQHYAPFAMHPSLSCAHPPPLQSIYSLIYLHLLHAALFSSLYYSQHPPTSPLHPLPLTTSRQTGASSPSWSASVWHSHVRDQPLVVIGHAHQNAAPAPVCRILLKHQSVTSWEDRFLKIESNDSRVPTRRDVLKQSFAAGAAISLPWIVSSRARSAGQAWRRPARGSRWGSSASARDVTYDHRHR